MATPADLIPRAPRNLKEWMIYLAIYALAGALFSSGRGPLSEEDASWQKWASLVAAWAVGGGLIGAMVHWLTGQLASYGRAIVRFAITMPLVFVFIELVRVVAAWYTSGWESSVKSAVIGAIVGMVLSPLMGLLLVALAKVLARVWPTGGAGSGSGSAR